MDRSVRCGNHDALLMHNQRVVVVVAIAKRVIAQVIPKSSSVTEFLRSSPAHRKGSSFVTMDPCTKIGQMKEQIEMETRARRSYAKKWGNLAPMQSLRALYHADELNRQLEEQQELQMSEPHSCFSYTGHGDSYFVSREIYEALVATCRCGRRRRGTHVLKCLQREREEYSRNIGQEEQQKAQTTPGNGGQSRAPETSSAFVGWRTTTAPQPPYWEWEKSTRYVSPVLTMPGPRIDAVPYNVIFIG